MNAGPRETPEELERRILLAVLEAADEFPDESLDVGIDEWRARIRGAAPAAEDDEGGAGATVFVFPALRPVGTMHRQARAASTRDASGDDEVSTLSEYGDVVVTATNLGSSSALVVVETPAARARAYDLVVLAVTEPGGVDHLHAAVLEPDGDALVGSVTISSAADELSIARSAPVPVTGLTADLLAAVLDEASDDALDAWRSQVGALPADHPVRRAVEDATGR